MEKNKANNGSKNINAKSINLKPGEEFTTSEGKSFKVSEDGNIVELVKYDPYFMLQYRSDISDSSSIDIYQLLVDKYGQEKTNRIINNLNRIEYRSGTGADTRIGTYVTINSTKRRILGNTLDNVLESSIVNQKQLGAIRKITNSIFDDMFDDRFWLPF